MSFGRKVLRKMKKVMGVGAIPVLATCFSQISRAAVNVGFDPYNKILYFSGDNGVIDESWQKRYTPESIEHIVIEDGIREIGKFAFCGCQSLKEITIPRSVTVLGNFAFLKCGSLKKVNIPNSINSIGICCFGCCTDLREVKFENIARDGGRNFANSCSEVMVGRLAFKSCLNLKVVDTGDRTAHFADKAFFRCNTKFRPLEGRNVRGCFYYSGIFDELIAHNFLVDKSVYWGR